jgi:hypothetical protein
MLLFVYQSAVRVEMTRSPPWMRLTARACPKCQVRCVRCVPADALVSVKGLPLHFLPAACMLFMCCVCVWR